MGNQPFFKDADTGFHGSECVSALEIHNNLVIITDKQGEDDAIQ